MIHIDASRYNNTGKRTGVENYSFFLINELAKSHPREVTLISPRKIPLDVPQIIIPFPRLWTHLRLSWLVLTNKDIKTLFVPSHVLPLICPKQSVITIHDVAFRHLPDSYGFFSRNYLDWATKFAVKKATSIIVPSEATKSDLINLYGANAKKIHVIPLGFSPTTTEPATPTDGHDLASDETLKKYGLKEKEYFLYVGRIEHKKNSDTLIKAFSIFAKNHPQHKLVLAGFAGRGGTEIIANIPHEIKPNIILTGYIGEEEKNHLLPGALCFIFPSRYEGFGLPLLEAVHHKIPVIASNIAASKEVMGSSALFFETENAEELSKRMEEILDVTSHAQLTSNYPNILADHTWAANSNSTFLVLERTTSDPLPC